MKSSLLDVSKLIVGLSIETSAYTSLIPECFPQFLFHHRYCYYHLDPLIHIRLVLTWASVLNIRCDYIYDSLCHLNVYLTDIYTFSQEHRVQTSAQTHNTIAFSTNKSVILVSKQDKVR